MLYAVYGRRTNYDPLPALKLTIIIQLILYKRYMECTFIQWRLSIYHQCTQVAEGTFFMKSPV